MTRSLPKTRKNPTNRLSVKLASLMWFPVVGFHQGQRRHKLRANRPDIRSKPTKPFKSQKVLAIRGRPHTTIGASRRSPANSVAISSKSSTIATSADRPSSPARCRSKIGTTSSPIRPSPMPSSTGSSTTLTASHSTETACEKSLRGAPVLTPPRKSDPTPMLATTPRPPSSEQVAAFDRTAWSRSIGIPGRNPRNPQY
jgi:hypothetical protein